MSLSPSSARRNKPQRRLKPEVAARIVARKHEAQIESLYKKSVQELSPEEIARMRAAFFRG